MKKLLILLVVFLPLCTYASPQDIWIDSLIQCESQGRENITILDSNNKYSYGIMQFQLYTFLGFGKKYGILPMEFTEAEGRLLIHNTYVQKAIAKEMLNDGLSYHWKNCARKIGYDYPMGDT